MSDLTGGQIGSGIGGGIGSILDAMNALDDRQRAQQILSGLKDNFDQQRNWDNFDVTQSFAPVTLPDGTTFTYDPNSGWQTKMSAPLQGSLTGGENQVDPYTLAGVQGNLDNAALTGLGNKYRDYENDAALGAMRQGFGSTATSPVLSALAQRQGEDVANTLAQTRANSYGTYNQAEQGFNTNRYAPFSGGVAAQSPILNAMQARSGGVNNAVQGGGNAANGAGYALSNGLRGFNESNDQSKNAYGTIGQVGGGFLGGIF